MVAPSGTPHVARPLLLQRNFGALWWGQLTSIFGERLNYLALLGLLAEHTDAFRAPKSSLMLSLLANVMLAPVLLFSPFTGAWLDRVNLRAVLIGSDLARAVLVALIPVLYISSDHTGPVFGLVFLLFTCNVLFLPAKSAITPEIVEPGQLLVANALLAAAGIAATAAGALVGGWVVDHWGWGTALWINAATYLVSVFSLMVIRYVPPERHQHRPDITLRGYLGEVAEGWRLVQRTPLVRMGMLTLGAVWIGGGFLHVAGNQHIQRAASIPGMERVGVLIAVVGLGAGLGTWVVNRHLHGVAPRALLSAGLMLSVIGVVAVAVSERFAVYAIASFVIGCGVAPVFVLSETVLQLGTDPAQRGRVFSARDFVMRLLFMLAVAAAGAVTRVGGTMLALLASAGVVLLAAVVTIVVGRGLHATHRPSA